MSKILCCPTCDQTLEWSPKNPFRPFCSEKCRLLDLGEWLSESYTIPGPTSPPPSEEFNRS